MSTATILVTYHTGQVLGRSITTLLAQDGLDTLVVVNNGNPPETVNALRHLEAADDRVLLITGQGNIGFARGCNLGANSAPADSEYLLFINPDCVLDQNTLPALLDTARDLPDPFIVSPLLVNPDGTEQRGGRRDVLTPWRATVEWTRLYHLAPNHPYFRRFNQHSQHPITDTSPVNVVSGAAMLMKRDTFDVLGGFDEQYFLHVEDIDLCLRLLRSGGTPWVCPHARLTHHASSSRASPVFIEWHKTRGFARYFQKHFAGVYPPGFLPLVRLGVYLRFIAHLPLLVIRHTRYVRRARITAATRQDVGRPEF
ncbi:MAG: glycosyltransferase family 2 protein [Pseudomonadales bacterium]|nr:glycosyltransferase family 2 protein [Pseudomonadales bacterium]MDP6472065.1 glycosyltransferase family 2 protein [Pseudomonadales bacterium]MDP6826662.1 glycosyltransferase family 2 protein [Pseudomonadales bacterium]MDP6969977.1 glycosyltransferase family 2 protein [Pseudomonadales bacterium]